MSFGRKNLHTQIVNLNKFWYSTSNKRLEKSAVRLLMYIEYDKNKQTTNFLMHLGVMKSATSCAESKCFE